MSAAPRRDLAVRLALGAWLVGWIVKAPLLTDLFVRVGRATPLSVEGLSAAFSAPMVPPVAYGLPVLAVGVGIVGAGRWALAAAAVGAACALALVTSVAAYNDATFVTAFWSALWIGWLASRPEAEAVAWGPRLAQGVVALLFLGGALGKLTPEYTSGAVLYDVYVLQKTTGIWPALRGALEPEALRTLAVGFSWATIAVEAALATCVLWPPRLALTTAAAVCTGMVAASTVYLTSVMAPVVGLCLSGLWLARGLEAPQPAGIGSPPYAPSPKRAKSYRAGSSGQSARQTSVISWTARQSS